MENLIFRINTANVTYEKSPGRFVATSHASAKSYVISGTAADIWANLTAGATIPECVDALLGRYIVSHEEAERSVKSFLDTLLKAGLAVSQPLDDSDPTELEFVSFANKRPFSGPTLAPFVAGAPSSAVAELLIKA